MSKDRLSIVNFIASSENCCIETINFNDVFQLSKSIKELSDRLRHVKYLLRLDLINDLDIFTFPKSRMKNNLITKTNN